jgi:hypothetical protein
MRHTLFAAAVLSIAAGSAMADLTLQGSGGAGWQAFPGAMNNYANPARAFWDQDTMDGGPTANRNIGNYLNGTYTLPLPIGSDPTPNTTAAWWGNAAPAFAGTMDASERFVMTTPSTAVAATLHLEVAGYAGVNEMGWYDTTDSAGAETLHAIFVGADSAGATTMFTPAASFGLYLRSGGGNVFFSDSARNRTAGGSPLGMSDLGTQHFAVFANDLTPSAERYTIGIEDLPLGATGREVVGDYNDMVVTFSPVPAPGAAGVLALGGLLGARRRRR